jgi:nitrilase
MAMEGACFVLVSTQVLSEKNHELTKTGGNPFFNGVQGTKVEEMSGRGFAMIFGPDGRPLCELIERGEEGVLIAEVDLKTTDFAEQVSLM